jgi:hypothetical protein
MKKQVGNVHMAWQSGAFALFLCKLLVMCYEEQKADGFKQIQVLEMCFSISYTS